jgi:hypothetical protein
MFGYIQASRMINWWSFAGTAIVRYLEPRCRSKKLEKSLPVAIRLRSSSFCRVSTQQVEEDVAEVAEVVVEEVVAAAGQGCVVLV